eukprot:3353858-Pyramimonas_sp.AAC.1
MSWQREDGSIRCHNTDRVSREWRLERTAVALRVRRMRWYMRWAQYPADHGAVLAAVFGDSVMDISEGVNRIANDNITASATPWAKQCLEDL